MARTVYAKLIVDELMDRVVPAALVDLTTADAEAIAGGAIVR